MAILKGQTLPRNWDKAPRVAVERAQTTARAKTDADIDTKEDPLARGGALFRFNPNTDLAVTAELASASAQTLPRPSKIKPLRPLVPTHFKRNEPSPPLKSKPSPGKATVTVTLTPYKIRNAKIPELVVRTLLPIS
jgi:hypothetical protein